MAPKGSILIVTQEFDLHADVMVGVLESMGHTPIRLHTSDFPTKALATMTFDEEQWRGVIEMHDRRIDVQDVKSIWWRRPGRSRFPAALSEDEQEFARLELGHTLRGLWGMLDCYWMSQPTRIRDAS